MTFPREFILEDDTIHPAISEAYDLGIQDGSAIPGAACFEVDLTCTVNGRQSLYFINHISSSISETSFLLKAYRSISDNKSL